MADAESKKLSNLRVVDLRAELEKRGLDKTGVKAALLERLQKALLAEGKNPDDYEFDPNEKKPKRLSTNARVEDNDTNAEHAASDSSVLMIETPSLEQESSGHELNPEEATPAVKTENDNVESPLNLSIGEEEEDLLNSEDEQDGKQEDEKTTPSGSADTTKEQDIKGKTQEEDKEDDRDGTQGVDAENPDGDADADVEADGEEKADSVRPRSDSLKDDDDESPDTSNVDSANTATTTAAAAAAASASASSPTLASEKDSTKDDHDNDKEKKNNPGRSLWVTNLLPSTRAQALKHLLSKYGKVIGAKVVQSSRYPRQRCYGYVTMETRAAADLCIEKLNNTELKGQIIRVAKVRPEHNVALGKNQKEGSSETRRKSSPNSASRSRDTKSGSEKKKTPPPTDKKRDDLKRKDSKEPERDRSRNNSTSSTRKTSLPKSSTAHRVERKADILTFDQIREERERQRARERERAMREEEKRRREVQRTREIEKRQREESLRLEREREKLRLERERLDRQRVEIMRLENQRQRLEREKLEQEKQELRRQQMRLEEAARRPVKRPSTTSASTYRREAGTYPDDRKRLVTDHHYEETPPPPRFEVPSREPAPDMTKNKDIGKDYKSRLAYSKRAEDYPPKRSGGAEFKRDYGPPPDRHSGGHPSHMVLNNSANPSTYVNRDRERDIREPTRREGIVPSAPPPRISKDTRYVERTGDRSPVSYRPVRDERERRPVSDHHSKNDIRSSRDHRYAETSMKEGTRYREGANSWHSSGAPSVKPFSGMGSSGNSRESWNKSDSWRPMDTNTNERWGNSSSRIIISGTSGVPNTMYSGGNSNLGLGAGLACPPPPGNSSYSMDRFDSSFKSLNSSRKY